MAWRREVKLTDEQRDELERVVRRDPKAYRRERASAILQVADGGVAAHVAASGLLVRRDPDAVYGWLDRYEEHGIAGLTIAAGRGRKPAAFPPSAERTRGRAGRPAGGAGLRPAGVADPAAADTLDAGGAARGGAVALGV